MDVSSTWINPRNKNMYRFNFETTKVERRGSEERWVSSSIPMYRPPKESGWTSDVFKELLRTDCISSEAFVQVMQRYYPYSGSVAVTPESLMSFRKACNHEWFCDYQSMFNPSMDTYSCKHCGVKKETV